MFARTVRQFPLLWVRVRVAHGRRLHSSLLEHPHFFLVPEAITAEEETALVAYLDPLLQRKRYEGEHWDSVIVKYKEAELRPVSARGVPMPQAVFAVLSRLQSLVIANYRAPSELLLPHAIDLADTGFIDYHVDNVRHSGGVLAGLSLLSTRCLRLREQAADASRDGYTAQGQGQALWSAADVAVLRQAGVVAAAAGEEASPAAAAHWAAVAARLNGQDKDKKLLRSALECQQKFASLLAADRPTSSASAPAPAAENGGERQQQEEEEEEEEETPYLEVPLPRRSLYMLDGPLRYRYGHAIVSPPGAAPSRRMSVIFRDAALQGQTAEVTAGQLDTGGLHKKCTV